MSAAGTWPLAARAQQPVVGFLSGRSLAYDSQLVAAFRQGLKEIGFVEGQNVAIVHRWAEGQFDRLPAMAADLVGRQVSVIFAGGLDVRIREVKAAISAIPIVFATAGDPELGLVASFNRPGGNTTAVTVISASLWPKRLSLLHELIASSIVVALLATPTTPLLSRPREMCMLRPRASDSRFTSFEPAAKVISKRPLQCLFPSRQAHFLSQITHCSIAGAKNSLPSPLVMRCHDLRSTRFPS